MGYFKKINFNNYRNLKKFSLNFVSDSNVIIGKNGSGKTNILEGISLFEKGRGFRKDKINNLINFENQGQRFDINAIFIDKNIEYNVNIFNSEKNLKKLSVNNSLELESSKHFESLFSIIYFLPEMERLFVASPSFRRNFFDRLIFNYDKNYNVIVNLYKKAILDRQLLIRKDSYDENWIREIENNIYKFGSIIYKKRIAHIDIINSIINTINSKEHFSTDFVIKIQDNFISENARIFEDREKYLLELRNRRKEDFFSGGCSIGPHRSNIIGYNKKNNFDLNQLSTGQQKTIVLLIIIAQSEYLIKNLKLSAIILLDEICSHLDQVNRELILYLTNQLNVQVFMTGTEKNLFSFLSTKANYCNIT